MSSCPKVPTTKTKIEGLGDVFVVLFREGDYDKIKELSAGEQIANALYMENGERVFSDDDVQPCIIEKMTTVTRNNVIKKMLEVNGMLATAEETKKS